MANRAPFFLIILALGAYVLFNSLFVLNEREQATSFEI